MEDVGNASVSLTQSNLKVAKLAHAVSSYRNPAFLSQKLQKTGATDVLDILDAERSLYSAESMLITAAFPPLRTTSLSRKLSAVVGRYGWTSLGLPISPLTGVEEEGIANNH